MTFLRRVRALFRKNQLDAEMAEEMRLHVELQAERNRATGMSPDEARYAALRQFGNVASLQERAREGRGWVWLEQAIQDVRFGFRQLARAPGFTAVVTLTLALGIGGTTAMFSMVDTVILNPVGGAEPERMVQIGQRRLVQGKDHFQGVSPPVLEALRTEHAFFSNVGWSFPAELERVTEDFVNGEGGAYVSWDFFATLQCPPLLGRGFQPEEAVLVEDGAPNRNTAIVLSHGWWQSHWGGDRGILGDTITMSGRVFTVVGVMPAHFQFPDQRTKFWIPLERQIIPPNSYAGPSIKVFARLRSDSTLKQAQALLDMIALRLMEAHPASNGYGAMWRMNNQSLKISLRPLSVALQDGGHWAQLRQTLLGLFAAVGLVLLIVCANVANLALARLERRQHEMAVRAALGAGRERLMRQLMTENLILALLGGAAGLLVTAVSLKVLIAMNEMPRLRPIEIDGRLLGVALLLSAFTALIFGLAPMWRGGNVRVRVMLADGGLNSTGGRARSHYRDALVVLQVAITVVLLSGAGLMLQSVSRLLRVDPGFDPQNLLLVEAQLPWRKYDLPDLMEGEKLRHALVAQLHERFSALPGVRAVGVQHRSYSQMFQLEGGTDGWVAEHVRVGVGGQDVFRAMRIPLVEGRNFVAGDVGRPGLVIVNEAFARQFWPGESAVGKKGVGGGSGDGAFEVIGVVGDARVYGYLWDALPTVYHPFQVVFGNARLIGTYGPQFVIRTTGDPESLVPFIRRDLKEAEPALRTPSIKMAKQVLYDSTLAQRTYRNYLGLFALLGLLLSALGVYGVLAFSVARRTREIGIRMAIGAEEAAVQGMVLKQGGRLIGMGMAVGILATFGFTRLLRSQLFGVSPTEPVALGGALLVLGVVALVACWLPARRAARVDPVVALRAE